MPQRVVHLRPVADGDRLRAGFDAVRAELDVPPAFPPDVLVEAERAAGAPRLPEHDLTDVAFLTIDPPGSMDLDQALHVERRDAGHRVRYAIADVAAFVAPGGAVDREAHARVQTLYAPDHSTPLHPPALSEGAASLLPGQLRPALVWTIDLDAAGEPVAADVRRAQVRSRERLDYAGAQAALDAGTADERLTGLAEVGRLRAEIERARGGISLPIPEQEVHADGDGYRLAYRAPLAVEGHNAQISLLAGMAAARIMLDGGVGLLRTLPAAPDEELARLRRAARALGVSWPEAMPYPELIRTLDPADPQHAALAQEATALLRGAGYTAFDGAPPAQPRHAALATEYAHVTAPLRRLGDRYAVEACAALCAGEPVPEWVRAALSALPDAMTAGDRRAGSFERACLDLVEAAVLAPAVGDTFDAVVVDVHREGGGGIVQLREPAVRAPCDGEPPLGEVVRVRLEEADPAARRVRFSLAGRGPTP